MRSRWLGIAAFAALATVGLAACGGDDDSSTPTPAATTPAGSTGTATRTATATGTAATSTATATTPAGGADALKRTVSLEDGATYSVTYEVTFVEDGKTTTGTYVVNQKPPKRAGTLTFDDGTISIIVDGERTWVCTAEGSDGICLRTNRSPDDTTLLPSGSPDQVVKDITDEVDDTRAREVGRRTIAGVEARCWEITSSDGNGTMCFSPNGVLLLNEGSFEGTSSRFVATRISSQVDDSAFDLPYDEIGGP
jgi:outer membrane lipoprotein-sorting protein